MLAAPGPVDFVVGTCEANWAIAQSVSAAIATTNAALTHDGADTRIDGALEWTIVHFEERALIYFGVDSLTVRLLVVSDEMFCVCNYTLTLNSCDSWFL